jgi:hypothetical protein
VAAAGEAAAGATPTGSAATAGDTATLSGSGSGSSSGSGSGSGSRAESSPAAAAPKAETAETLAAVEPLYLSDEDDDAPAPIRALVVTDWPAGGRSARRGAAGCRG